MAAIQGLIKTEADYEAAMGEIEDFFADLPKPGTKRGNRFELLSFLVAKYEEDNLPILDADPVALIRFAIEDMGHSQAELSKLLGSSGRASEIINRRRPLTLENIRAISTAWKLPFAALGAPYHTEKPAAHKSHRIAA